MEIALQAVPPDVIAAASDWLNQAANRRPFLTHLLRIATPGRFALSTWHRILEVGVGDLLAKKPLEQTAREVGWRFLVHADAPVVAAMEVRKAADGRQLPPSLTEDPCSLGTVDGISAAEQFAVDGDWPYEITFVTIPGLQVWVLWMRAADAPNWIVPVAPALAELPAGAVFPLSDFMAIAYELSAVSDKLQRQAGSHA